MNDYEFTLLLVNLVCSAALIGWVGGLLLAILRKR